MVLYATIVIFLMIAKINNSLAFNYDLLYLEDYCKSGQSAINLRNNFFSSSVILKGKRYDSIDAPTDCIVTLVGMENSSILLTVETADNIGFSIDGDQCAIKMVPTDAQHRLDTKQTQPIVAGNSVSIKFNPSSNYTENFKIIASTFKYVSPCPAFHFDCGQNRCIRSELTCDGYNNCGNNSDESYCFVLTVNSMLACSVSLATLIFFAVVFHCIVRCRDQSVNVNLWRLRQQSNDLLYASLLDHRNRQYSYNNYGTCSKLYETPPPPYEHPPAYPGVSKQLVCEKV